jgi:hypothetical protein
MPNVIVDITMSLDGFVTGEHADEQQELGDPPEPLGSMQRDAATPRFSNTRPPRPVRW